MTIVLTSAAFAPDVPQQAAPLGISHEWESGGSVWSLNDWEKGLFLDDRGVQGLHFPRMTKFESKSAAVPGVRQRGFRTEKRAVVWSLQIWGEDSADWVERMGEFFDSIHPTREGVWRVRVGDSVRQLRLTGVFDEDHLYEFDPVFDAWSPYAVRLEAAQPYWEGEKITRGPWRTENPVPFFPGPPFTISPGATAANATISNPGDVEAYPVWVIDGPWTHVAVGVGGRVIDVPFEIEEGRRLRIDTDPRNVTAMLGPDDGSAFVWEDVTKQLGFQRTTPVAPGGSLPVTIDATGAGSVAVELVPLYFRAF